MNPILTFLVVLAALVLAIVVLVASRFKVAGPNEAFIVTGRKGQAVTNPETGRVSTNLSGQKVVMGASTFVLPIVQKLAILDLSSRQIAISVDSAVSAQGIKCSLEGVAIVKVGGTEDAVRARARSASSASRTRSSRSPRRSSPARCAPSSVVCRSRRS